MATEVTQSDTNSIKKLAIIPGYNIPFKKNNGERIAPPAKAKYKDVSFQTLKLLLANGKIEQRIAIFNDEIGRFRNGVEQKEYADAEKEAKINEKVGQSKGAEFNENLYYIRLKSIISKATEPSKVIPVLDNNQMVLTDEKSSDTSEYAQVAKPKRLMIAALLKEQVGSIGGKVSTYAKKEEKKEEAVKEEEAKPVKVRSTKNAKWKKAFKNLAPVEAPVVAKTTKTKEVPIIKEDTRTVSEGEIRRRKLIGEAGEELEKIVKELGPAIKGENDKFDRALMARQNRLVDIISNCGNTKISNYDDEFGFDKQNTLFQDYLDQLYSVKEAPTKEEHDKEQERITHAFTDPFNAEQNKRQLEEGWLYYLNNPDIDQKIKESERIADRAETERRINKQAESIKEVNEEILATKSKKEKEEEERKANEEAKALGRANGEYLFQRNLAAMATDEVMAKYREKFAEQLETLKQLKRSGEAQAEILFQKELAERAISEIVDDVKKKYEQENVRKSLEKAAKSEAEAYMLQNLAVQAVEEVTNFYRTKLLKSIEERNEMVSGASIQAEMLYQKDLTLKAIEEVRNEIKTYYQTEAFRKQIAPSVRAQSNALLFQNLAAQAVDEVVSSVKKEYEKEATKKRNLKADANSEANAFYYNNLAATAVEEVTEKMEKDSGIHHMRKMKDALKKGKAAVTTKGIKDSANVEAKRINRLNNREMIREGAADTANLLYVKGLKYDADVLANKMFNQQLAEAGNVQAQELFTEAMREEGRNEAKIINLNRLREMAQAEASEIVKKSRKIYDFTDVDSRYLREFRKPKAILVDHNKYTNLGRKAKANYGGNSGDSYMDNMIESLMGQLEELGLGDDSMEETGRRLAA